MKRRSWWILGALVLGAGSVGVALFPSHPREEYPLAELVPGDALFYAGFSDHRALEGMAKKFPHAWTHEAREGFRKMRPLLAGGVAFYVDRDFEWVGLARVKRASALFAGAEIQSDAVVFAQSPAALERQKRRQSSLVDNETFRSLRSRIYLNLEALNPPGRLGDFTAAGFELEAGPPLLLRGRLAYRADRLRLFAEEDVHAPRHAAPRGTAPAEAFLVEQFPRLWEELKGQLSAQQLDLALNESTALSGDPLGGRPLGEFLREIGPTWGLRVAPTPFGLPAVVAWVDLPGEGTAPTLRRVLDRVERDLDKYARAKGLAPPFQVVPDHDWKRIDFPWAPTLRLGPAFAPAYRIEGHRWVLSTCQEVLSAPDLAPGDFHATAQLELAPLVEMARTLAPLLADRAFQSQASQAAEAAFARAHPPAAMAELLVRLPDPSERARVLGVEVSQMYARALEELSKSSRYQEELGRARGQIEAWAGRLGWLERVSFSGRFTGAGLEFELRGWTK